LSSISAWKAGILIVIASALVPIANRVPSARYTSTLMTFAAPNSDVVPNGCSENVRISGAVEPESSRLANPLSTNVAR